MFLEKEQELTNTSFDDIINESKSSDVTGSAIEPPQIQSDEGGDEGQLELPFDFARFGDERLILEGEEGNDAADQLEDSESEPNSIISLMDEYGLYGEEEGDVYTEFLLKEDPHTSEFISHESTSILVGGDEDAPFVYDVSESGVKEHAPSETSLRSDPTVNLEEINPISIEYLNLDAALSNAINLSADRVYSMSDTHHITIEGCAYDQVNLEGDWAVQNNEYGYTTYISDQASVSIDNDIVHAGGVHIV